MKQVLVQAFCDLCAVADDGGEGDQVPAVVEVTHEGRLLDVCERHQRVVEGQKQALERLFAMGVEVERPKRGRGRPGRPMGHPPNPPAQDVTSEKMRTCREPGCTVPPSPTRSALGQHTRTHHNKGLSEYDWST